MALTRSACVVACISCWLAPVLAETNASSAGLVIDSTSVLNQRVPGPENVGTIGCPQVGADIPQQACPPCGDCTCATCQDGRIELCEMTGYACAWKKGCNDNLTEMTRAAFIWKRGECYCWEEAQQDWFLTPCPAPLSGCCSVPAPLLDPHTRMTRESSVTVTGSAPGAGVVEVSGPAGVSETTVVGRRFSAEVPLVENHVNRIFFTAINPQGTRSAPIATAITHDAKPPSLFIDFPADGAEITTEVTDVAGRVGDLLGGFMGLTVTVNGVNAIVDVGIGNNGTFFRPSVPLALGDNAIIAVATDVLGNTRERQINVTRVEIPPDAPQMVAVSGNGQVAQMGTLLSQPIVVAVTHGDGTPFENKVVTFDVTRSNGRLTTDGAGEGALMLQLFTDAAGEVRAFWRLGFDAGCGNNRVEVTSRDIAGTTFFCASATPAPAGQVNVGSGNNQRAETGAPAPEPLRVWVSDACNGVSDIPVTFTVVRGGGTINGQDKVAVLTGDTGHAEVDFTLGPEAGNHVVEATFPDNPGAAARFVLFGVVRRAEQPTALVGRVMDNAEQPIQGATCTLAVGGISEAPVQSDIDGRFRFEDIAGSGPAELHVDGLTAFHVGGPGGRDVPLGSFPALHYEPVIVPNAENALPTPVRLPMLNPNNAVMFDNTRDLELTVEGIEGLKMLVRAGSMTRADGSVPTPADPAILTLNQVHSDDIPMPMPDGAAPPFAWTLQPAGARFDPPVEIIYPNMSGLPAGMVAYFLSFDHDTMRFEIVATGQVTADAQCIVSDPGAGISVAGWGCNCPPYSAIGECCQAGSDTASGGGPASAAGTSGAGSCENCTADGAVSKCGPGLTCCGNDCVSGDECCSDDECGGTMCCDGRCSPEDAVLCCFGTSLLPGFECCGPGKVGVGYFCFPNEKCCGSDACYRPGCGEECIEGEVGGECPEGETCCPDATHCCVDGNTCCGPTGVMQK